MKWIHRLRSGVDNKVQSKGGKYCLEGAVQIGFGDRQEVRATVTGTRDYPVELRLDGDAVVAFCDCDHFFDGHICKHIWATMLEAESMGHLTNVAIRWSPYMEHGLDSDNLDDGDLIDDDELISAAQQRHDRIQPPKEPAIEPWKQHLSTLRRIAAARSGTETEPARKIFYVVDISECLVAGAIVLYTVPSRLKQNGEWGKPNFQEHWIHGLTALDPSDSRILSLLGGTSNSQPGYSINSGSASTRHRPFLAALDVLFPLICATGQLFYRSKAGDNLKPLVWNDGAQWTFRVHVHAEDSAYAITGTLTCEGEECPLSEAILLVPGLAFFQDHVSRFDDTGKFEWVSVLRREQRLTIPAKHRAEFVNELIQFPDLPQMELPDDIQVENATPTGAPDLKIRPTKQSWNNQQKLECEITFNYAGVKVAEANPAWAVHDGTRDRFIRRDRIAETHAIQRAADLGLRRNSWNSRGWEVPARQMPALVRTLVAEGWRVEAEGKLYRRPGELKVAVTSGIDWFEVRGGAEFEGQSVGLPELLKAVARGDNIVRLDDGSFGLVPEDWLKRYRLVSGLGKSDGDSLRFTRGQAGLLDALLANQPEVTFDEGFTRVHRELQSFSEFNRRNRPQRSKVNCAIISARDWAGFPSSGASGLVAVSPTTWAWGKR